MGRGPVRGGLAGVGSGGGRHRYVGSPGRSGWGGPAAQTGGGTIRKSPWLATVFEAKDRRLANGSTIEPSATERGSAGRKMLDARWAGAELIDRKRPARNGSRAAVACGKSGRL